MTTSTYAAEMTVLYRIMNAEVKQWPFPHFQVFDVFPLEVYAALIDNPPINTAFDPMNRHGTVSPGSYPERLIRSLTEQTDTLPGPWQDLAGWMLGDRFARAILKKFMPYISKQRGGAPYTGRVLRDARLVRDLTGYALSPHTDAREKLLALLFYLPRDTGQAHLGTSLYVPNDPNFRCPGGPHHPREDFTLLATAPFLPNSLFGFVRTDNAFHGVEPVQDIGAQRNLLLYNLFAAD